MAAAAPSTQATASVIWSGWLSKRTPGGSHIYRQYHKRFFVLTQDAIHYYKHPYVRDDTATAPGQRAGSVHSSTGVSALSLLKRDGNGGEDGGGSGTGEGEGDGNGNGSRGGGGRLGAPPPPPAPAPGAPAVDSFEAVDARLRSDGLSQMGLIGVKDISAILVKSDLELLLETTELPVPLKTDDPATLRTFRMGLTRALKQHASELADESARLILLKAELETRHKDEIERYQAAATASKGEAQRAEDEAARLSAEVKRLKRLLEAQPSVGMSTSAPASGASIHLLGEDAGRDGERKLAHDEGVYYSKSATPLFDKMGVEEAGLVGQLRAELVEMRKALDLANGRAAECARRAELAERQCRELQTRLFGALDAKIQEILDAERKVLEVEETNAAKLSSLDDKLTHIYNTVTSVMRVATFLAEGGECVEGPIGLKLLPFHGQSPSPRCLTDLPPRHSRDRLPDAHIGRAGPCEGHHAPEPPSAHYQHLRRGIRAQIHERRVPSPFLGRVRLPPSGAAAGPPRCKVVGEEGRGSPATHAVHRQDRGLAGQGAVGPPPAVGLAGGGD
mmetsp:Transcript_91857/g.262669  ORF Transcript_91857/g.262669 Transcript_91857/m.262669 type:complete len:563 (-) Transcript_91857:1450-3138(-)